jgi:hypothetical protein
MMIRGMMISDFIANECRLTYLTLSSCMYESFKDKIVAIVETNDVLSGAENVCDVVLTTMKEDVKPTGCRVGIPEGFADG